MKLPERDTPERMRLMLWIGAAGAALAALGGMWGFHDGSVWRGPRALEARVESALLAAGYPGLEVEMHGQKAVLRGVLESAEAIAAAQRAAITAAGPGGLWAGGVTRADITHVEIGGVERPFALRIRREPSRIVLSGAAPSAPARAELLASASAAFPNAEAIDNMHIAGGAPTSQWTDVARGVLRDLATLNSGEARIIDDQIVIIGDGERRAVDRLRQRYRTPPEPFRARIVASVNGQETALPQLSGLDLSTGSVDACGTAFARLMDRNVINFESGSAVIDPSSAALLDSLAVVALRCDRFVIDIAGHTDNQGDRAANMELSRQRANAVARYLASQGVATEQLRPEGYGPDRPRAPNATPEGQAANRRIEFNVSG
jgi:OmpA-OmpF porin, OOP family